MALEGENAQTHLRKIVGATDPTRAVKGTIRSLFGKSVTDNSIHASDSKDSASRELSFFFAKDELFSFSKITN
jgi:nucleoside-diphosphate kinase